VKFNVQRGIKTLYLSIIILVIIIAIIGGILAYNYVSAPKPPSKISFYTWWAGLERFAIDAVIGNFTAKTGIQVEKTAVPGGAGVNAKFAILALIQAGKPPAAFQVHCGPEMLSYIYASPHGEKDFVELNSVAKDIGMTDQAPDVLKACALAGKIYTLPVNIHRANLIFINKQILDKIGGKVPTTIEELVDLSKKSL